MTQTLKGKLLITTGWVVVGVGCYLVLVGNSYIDGNAYFKPRTPNDTIIDAEWYEVD